MSRTSRQSGAYRGRFAPSPSGWLHLGNARTALFAWGRARAVGGAFVMRVEDLDAQRTRPEAVVGNLDELAWLGLDWDEGPDVGGPFGPYMQSERLALYEVALTRLAEAGHLFECFLSRREIADASSGDEGVDDAGEGQGEQSARVYGKAQRELNAELAPERRRAGRAPSLRFRVPTGTVVFRDAVQGDVVVDLQREVGDFVVRRADGQVAYQLAVVVDDALMGMTEVARGADLLSSTAAQALLCDALGWPRPKYAHVGLLLAPDGSKLSKRGGALSLHELHGAGTDPRLVLGILARSLGWLEDTVVVSAGELLERLRERGAAAPAKPLTLPPSDLAALTGVDS
ncbi:MAG TPA: tRNA glutamyl-Q(34) synthetase GluQRS [Trueperaceae bacterium]|nr:tRNA glutamyl-Q(34) synthetase GluQRS [Trueperaceae bacterium]